jgi:hypothetical protein
MQPHTLEGFLSGCYDVDHQGAGHTMLCEYMTGLSRHTLISLVAPSADTRDAEGVP